MVGDGINDAAALAQADIGIAMAGGVGAASEVASIVLLGDRLPQVVDAIDLSKATFNKIKQNLGWAFGYNLIGIPIAAGALLPAYGIALTPSVAGAIMGFSSLGVMGNSLLLKLKGRELSKPPEEETKA
jgi:P-type Cu+ transporter